MSDKSNSLKTVFARLGASLALRAHAFVENRIEKLERDPLNAEFSTLRKCHKRLVGFNQRLKAKGAELNQR